MRKISFFIITALMAVSVVQAAPVKNVLSEGYYVGLDIFKQPVTALNITDGNSKNPVAGRLLSFGTPKNVANDREVLPASAPYLQFGVHFTLQQAGTLFVFFTARNDLGYSSVTEADKYMNPWMLVPAGGSVGLNYEVTGFAMEGPGLDTPGQSYTSHTQLQSPISEIELYNLGSAEGVGTVIHSGLCFRHHITEAEVNNGKTEGHDVFRLQLVKPAGVKLKSGLYFGYVVIHFTAK